MFWLLRPLSFLFLRIPGFNYFMVVYRHYIDNLSSCLSSNGLKMVLYVSQTLVFIAGTACFSHIDIISETLAKSL